MEDTVDDHQDHREHEDEQRDTDKQREGTKKKERARGALVTRSVGSKQTEVSDSSLALLDLKRSSWLASLRLSSSSSSSSSSSDSHGSRSKEISKWALGVMRPRTKEGEREGTARGDGREPVEVVLSRTSRLQNYAFRGRWLSLEESVFLVDQHVLLLFRPPPPLDRPDAPSDLNHEDLNHKDQKEEDQNQKGDSGPVEIKEEDGIEATEGKDSDHKEKNKEKDKKENETAEGMEKKGFRLMTVGDCVQAMAQHDLPLEHYLAYSHLRRLGFNLLPLCLSLPSSSSCSSSSSSRSSVSPERGLYMAYRPGAPFHRHKSDLPADFLLAVFSARDRSPSVREVKALWKMTQNAGQGVVLAVVQSANDISFLNIDRPSDLDDPSVSISQPKSKRHKKNPS